MLEKRTHNGTETFSQRLIDWTAAGLFPHWCFIFKAIFLFIILDLKKKKKLYTHVNLNKWQFSLSMLFSALSLKTTLYCAFCTRSVFMTGFAENFLLPCACLQNICPLALGWDAVVLLHGLSFLWQCINKGTWNQTKGRVAGCGQINISSKSEVQKKLSVDN